jgi:general secretion pathway protein M
MSPGLRRTLSALGLVGLIVAALAAALSTLADLRDARARVAEIADQSDALRARERSLVAKPPAARGASPFFEARTITQAGAALQQRVEAAVAAAHGRLISSRVDVAQRNDPQGLSLSSELSLADDGLQALLFDLETGRPYLFVDAIEARPEEATGEPGRKTLRVALTVSGEWSQAK